MTRHAAAYTHSLIDRLLQEPSSITERELRKLHAETAEHIHLLLHTPLAAAPSATPSPALAAEPYLRLLDRFAPERWHCTKCSCLWRLNPPFGEPYKPPLLGQRSWSLWDGEQKSCAVCDNSSEFLSVIEPDNEEIKDQERLLDKLSGLLRGVCDALKGKPPALTHYSWHDLPALAATWRKRAEDAEHALAESAAPAAEQPTERSEDARDAARYKFLRGMSCDDEDGLSGIGSRYLLDGADLDAAIDRAIAEQAKGRKP